MSDVSHDRVSYIKLKSGSPAHPLQTAIASLSLREGHTGEEIAEARQDAESIVETTRAARSRLAELEAACERAEVEAKNGVWEMKEERAGIELFNSKEQQYQMEIGKHIALRERARMRGYLTHDKLVGMSNRYAQLDAELKPMEERLAGYKNLPPDKELAQMAIEDKRRRIELVQKEIERCLS